MPFTLPRPTPLFRVAPGLGGLWDARGRGAKAKWLEADMAYLEQCLEQEPRTYNSQQLSQKLKQERQVNLSADRIRRLLQKRALTGSELGTRNEEDKTPAIKPLNKQTRETLKLAAEDGYIELKYLDESGCCLESPVSYSYAPIGEQKCLEQVKSYGERISILGVWQPD